MILLAFDVDGTLDNAGPETNRGPVSWVKMKALAGPDVVLGIVSNSSWRPKDDTPAYLPNGGTNRQANLQAFADAYPEATLRLYVSNNGPHEVPQANAAGFVYVSEEAFAQIPVYSADILIDEFAGLTPVRTVGRNQA